jgi:hypothetical protein
VVGAWRLMGVCRASREGAKEWLRTLPGLVVCGGFTSAGEFTGEVWRLDLGELPWERMPSLTHGRADHACCAVRGGVVVLGGLVEGQEQTASVEILGSDSVAGEDGLFKVLPPLSRGIISSFAAAALDESESDQGQVLLLGGRIQGAITSSAHKVDLATGVCAPQPSLLSQHGVRGHTAARLADGRIVCVGKNVNNAVHGTAQVLEPPPPEHASPSEASWQWRYLPDMSVGRYGGRGCVLSDNRFAVFGGGTDNILTPTASCEVLTLDGDIERWDPLAPMHEARRSFASAAIGGCVIVAGGWDSSTAEVYEEALGRWRQLPCSLPHEAGGCCMGSAMM